MVIWKNNLYDFAVRVLYLSVQLEQTHFVTFTTAEINLQYLAQLYLNSLFVQFTLYKVCIVYPRLCVHMVYVSWSLEAVMTLIMLHRIIKTFQSSWRYQRDFLT